MLSALQDFDFLHGSWTVQNRRLRHRLAGSDDWEDFVTEVESRPLLEGRGNVDTYRGVGSDLSAVALRLLDPVTDLWSIYWADGSSADLGRPVQGRFDGDVGEFYGDDQHDGRPVRVRFVWRRLDVRHATWEQAFSVDGGVTWESNWLMSWTRQEA